MKRLYTALLLVAFMLGLAGCRQSEKIEKTSSEKAESIIDVQELQNFNETTLIYTKKSEIIPNVGINNIYYSIQEYCNVNKNEYYYVLDIKHSPLTESQKKAQIVPFNIVKVSVGGVQNKATDSFIYSVSSPVFIDFNGSYVKDGSYFLFSMEKAVDVKDFQIEYIFTNAVQTGDKQVGEETYRYMSNEDMSILSE